MGARGTGGGVRVVWVGLWVGGEWGAGRGVGVVVDGGR